MQWELEPSVCDLCGSDKYTVLLNLSTGRAMRSDQNLVASNLVKLKCSRCGLVRGGSRYDAGILQDFYAHEYANELHPSDYYFYTRRGPVARSVMFADWMISLLEEHRWQKSARCLEIGTSSGALLQELTRRFQNTSFEGLELNQSSSELARKRGLSVRSIALESMDSTAFDLVYSIAVLEHVISPTQFLNEICKRLRPGGCLLLCQPTQDVSSYDLFFYDHVHHFGSEHLRQYARKCGFREQGFIVGHEWMPNFSLHFWQKADTGDIFEWAGPPGFTTCVETSLRVIADMAALNELLARLQAEQRRVAVFGLNEVYWLACAYSALGDYPLVCGLVDQPENPRFAQLGFPVVTPEQCLALGVQDVILTMNKVYYPQASERLESLRLRTHRVLS